MANHPGPYEVRIFYSVDTSPGGSRVHQTRLSCVLDPEPDPGDLFTGIDLTKGDGGSIVLSTAVNAFCTVAKVFFNSTDMSFDYAELWKYISGTFKADFISSYTLGIAGTDTDPTIPASEVITTFRTAGGSVFKNYLLDTSQPLGVRIPYADLVSPFDAYADHFMGSTTRYWVARDDTYPLSCLYLFPGQSEAVFKRRYRS